MTGRHLDLVLKARRVLTEKGEVAAAVGVAGRRIALIDRFESSLTGAREVLLDDDVVLMPGLVDTHVHVCEPGHGEWEGFETATRAAAAGGITTLVDMPLDSVPVTVSVPALEEKRAAARGHCHIDVGFWGGVIPTNLDSLEQLIRSGVLGFKCFLSDSGLEEFPPIDASTLMTALCLLRETGYPLLVHAEDEETASAQPPPRGRSYSSFLRSRPKEVENRAIATVITAARQSQGWAHICHISSSDAIPQLAHARTEGLSLTTETCPHYLSLVAEEIPDGATAFKCSPPVRESANREALWDGLASGAIDLVVSDHSPCAAEMKHLADGDFGAAWGGIPALQLSLPVLWSDARSRGYSLADVSTWMAKRTAKLAGCSRKGSIAPGFDADLVVFAPDETFTVNGDNLLQRNKTTPYDGCSLYGVVRRTFLGGDEVGDEQPKGRLIEARDASTLGARR